MAQISEKWELRVGKNKHIVSGQEKDMVLNAGQARFVKFRDLVINPAFVQDITLIERVNEVQIEAPKEEELTIEQRKKNRERIAKMKAGLMNKIKK